METQNKITSTVTFPIFLLLICYVCDISGQWYPVHRRSYFNYGNINDETSTNEYDDAEGDAPSSLNWKWIIQPQNSMKLTRTPSNDMRKSDNTVPNDKVLLSSRMAEPLRLKVGAAPACEGKTYCENVSNYPLSIVEKAVKSDKTVPIYENVDGLDTIQFRFNSDVTSESESLCASDQKIVFPKAAENRDNVWMFVINTDNFTQGVHVETCTKEGSSCRLFDGYTAGYVTSCEQKYTFRLLAAISSDGELIKDHFRLPTSCCCAFQFVGNSLRLRDKRSISSQSRRNFN